MKKTFRPVVTLFAMINVMALAFATKLKSKGIDNEVIIIGNLVIFIGTVASAWLYLRAMETKNAQAIMRSVYGGFMLKFFLLLAAALVYIATANPINKPTIFICMGLYLVYHFLSTANVLKQKKTTPVDGDGKTSV
ncbi:MAG: hypothetical protein ABIX01_23420 [Chitinophagaceae bacterium]